MTTTLGRRAATQLEQVILSSQRLGERSKKQYLRDVRSFLEFARMHLKKGATPDSAWNGAMVEQWRDWMREQGVIPTTINGKLAALRYASKRYSELYGGKDFARAPEFLAVAREKKRHALQVDDAQALIATCSTNRPLDLRDLALFTVGFRCGVRREGIVNINIEDLGKKNEDGSRTCTVILKAVPGQPPARHTFMMDAETTAGIDPWLSYLRRAGITSGPLFRAVRKDAAKMARERRKPYGRAPKPVMADPTISETRLSCSGLEKALKKRAAQAGIHFHPHLMRHSLVSWLVAADVPKARIKGLTGHKTDTMIDLYTTDVLQEADPVGNYLPKLGKK
jgi:site-specific recombinase XerD